jgi:fumarate hydratase, class II
MSTGTEHDTMGAVEVPTERLWAAQTQRSLQNFDISGEQMPREIIRALAQVKRTSATVNHTMGLLDQHKTQAIVVAADEVIANLHPQEFPLVVWQTGSGTQTNMNLNEVLTNRIGSRILGLRSAARAWRKTYSCGTATPVRTGAREHCRGYWFKRTTWFR